MLTSQADARVLLARAEKCGDEELATAVFGFAYDSGWTYVVDAYVATRPERAAALAELRECERESVDDAFVDLFPLPPLPAVLEGLSDHQMQALANVSDDASDDQIQALLDAVAAADGTHAD